jgi:hypothetical protein
MFARVFRVGLQLRSVRTFQEIMPEPKTIKLSVRRGSVIAALVL